MVVDDHAAIREGVKMILARDREISVIGECASGDAAVTMADKRRPDVVLMDVRMRGMDGFEATRRITATHPDMAVILYTAHARARPAGRGAGLRRARLRAQGRTARRHRPRRQARG